MGAEFDGRIAQLQLEKEFAQRGQLHIARYALVEIAVHHDADAPWVLPAFRLVEFGIDPAIGIDAVVETVASAPAVMEKDELHAAPTGLDGIVFVRFRFQADGGSPRGRDAEFPQRVLDGGPADPQAIVAKEVREDVAETEDQDADQKAVDDRPIRVLVL